MSAWTPGPWHISGKHPQNLHIGSPNSRMVLASMNDAHMDTPANARLIAAAPEMADALEKAAAQFEFHEQSHRAKGTQDGDAKAETNRAMAAEIHAILARIKGAS